MGRNNLLLVWPKVGKNHRARRQLDVSVVKNRLAKELLTQQPPAVGFRRTCFCTQGRLFFMTSTQVGSLCPDPRDKKRPGRVLKVEHSRGVRNPSPKPERSSLQSDYEASSFWCADVAWEARRTAAHLPVVVEAVSDSCEMSTRLRFESGP